MNKWTKNFLLIVVLFCFSTILKGESKHDILLKLKEQIDKEYYSFNQDELKILLKSSEKVITKYPNDWHPLYYSAVLCMQLGKINYLPEPDIAYDYFDKSLDYLLKAHKKNKSAELLALISAAYGKKSSLSILSAIYYGIKAKNYIIEANELDSNNSKVKLIAATHLMHTPESFGGDKEWAGILLSKALKLNYSNHKKSNSLTLNWAEEPEIYAYLAQLEILKNDKSKAQLYIEKALKLKPNYGFVKYDILEQLKKL